MSKCPYCDRELVENKDYRECPNYMCHYVEEVLDECREKDS